jgi:hypothetical protein
MPLLRPRGDRSAADFFLMLQQAPDPPATSSAAVPTPSRFSSRPAPKHDAAVCGIGSTSSGCHSRIRFAPLDARRRFPESLSYPLWTVKPRHLLLSYTLGLSPSMPPLSPILLCPLWSPARPLLVCLYDPWSFDRKSLASSRLSIRRGAPGPRSRAPRFHRAQDGRRVLWATLIPASRCLPPRSPSGRARRPLAAFHDHKRYLQSQPIRPLLWSRGWACRRRQDPAR